MRKFLIVWMVLTLTLGTAAMTSAGMVNCTGAAGHINRGCEAGLVTYCIPFDFENCYDYCDSMLSNRALFRICDCIADGDIETLVAGDVIEVSMEILVDKGNGKVPGDNGVYWAENVNGIGLGLYDSQEAACADVINEDQDPRTCPEYAYGIYFAGQYQYLTATGTVGTPTMSSSCTVAAANRVVKIVPAEGQEYGTYGYTIRPDDELFGNATWAIDIPEMRVDTSMVNGGEKVWVKVCLIKECPGICNADEICCAEIYIGELCCDYYGPGYLPGALLNCAGDAGYINRGCASQATCAPFDFENTADYCGSNPANRSVFKICDCIGSAFEDLAAGDVVNVAMEILVDYGGGKDDGDNGVYWAENVNAGSGIGLGLYTSQTTACGASTFSRNFIGNFQYLTATGTAGTPLSSNACSVAAANRVVKIAPVADQTQGTFGYTVTQSDVTSDYCSWAVNIPRMRYDSSIIKGGEKVWIRMTLIRDGVGFGYDEFCSSDIYIGELCCPENSLPSAAAGVNCAGVAGHINRGCGSDPVVCAPFDFENVADYCSLLPKNRMLFNMCDCIVSGEFETVVAGDVIESSMEILVDKGAGKAAGDNGVYWAQTISINGIPMGTYASQSSACNASTAYDAYFGGLYNYLTVAGVAGAPLTTESCTIGAANRVVKIVPAKGQALGTYGYTVTNEDELFGNCVWAIDIPRLRVDSSRVSGGEKVWVRVCLSRDCTGLCSSDEICCADIYVGTLCCFEPSVSLMGPLMLLLQD